MAVTLKKPATTGGAKAPALKKPGAGAKAAAAATKPKAEAKPAKPKKPFEASDIVIFQGYAAENPNPLFTKDEELAVVSQREENGKTIIVVTKASQYHAFVADPDNGPDAEELSDVEVKRTSRKVEPLYELVAVGRMGEMLTETDGDYLALGQHLWSSAQESFFYLGGVLAHLWEGKTDEGVRNFSVYTDAEDKAYSNDTEGFDKFLKDNFAGEELGERKAKGLIGVYNTFSTLPNADEVVSKLAAAGWSKAVMLTSYVTEANAAELVDKAAEMPIRELQSVLKTEYTTDGGTSASGKSVARAKIEKTTFSFQAYADIGTGLAFILESAKKQLGSEDLNQVFEHIVTEWAGDHMAEIKGKADAKARAETAKLVKNKVKFPANHPQAKLDAEAAAKAEAEAKAAAPAATAKPKLKQAA